MNQTRLRIVGKAERNFIDEVRKYYFSLEETTRNLDVPETWILQNLVHLPDRTRLNGTWYFSPADYHALRELKDEDYRPAVG